MNFSKQLKQYRELNGFSQEELADKLYVTRQTISKWENDKTYPDIHNLIALSVLFEISIDELVKGDITVMKTIISKEQIDKDTKGMLIAILLSILIGVPSIVAFGTKGLIPFGILSIMGMYFAIKLEVAKKKYNLKTFKEIVAFSEGDSDLEELQKQRDNEEAFREKAFIVFMFTLSAGVLGVIMFFLTDFFLKL